VGVGGRAKEGERWNEDRRGLAGAEGLESDQPEAERGWRGVAGGKRWAGGKKHQGCATQRTGRKPEGKREGGTGERRNSGEGEERRDNAGRWEKTRRQGAGEKRRPGSKPKRVDGGKGPARTRHVEDNEGAQAVGSRKG